MSAGVDHNANRSARWRGHAIASAVSATVMAPTHHVTDVAASATRSQARLVASPRPHSGTSSAATVM